MSITSPIEKANTVVYERRKKGDNIKICIKIIRFYDLHIDKDSRDRGREKGGGKHCRCALLIF